MTRGELFGRAEQLSDRWCDLSPGVIDEIIAHPVPVAVALAVVVARNLDEVFDQGMQFRAALAERATK